MYLKSRRIVPRKLLNYESKDQERNCLYRNYWESTQRDFPLCCFITKVIAMRTICVASRFLHTARFPHLLENLEKYSTPGKPGKIMEFCQSGNVGTLGYRGNYIFLIRWNFYANIDPKIIGGHLKKIQKIYLDFFFEKPGKIMEISWNFVSPEMWEPWHCHNGKSFIFTIKNGQLCGLHGDVHMETCGIFNSNIIIKWVLCPIVMARVTTLRINVVAVTVWTSL